MIKSLLIWGGKVGCICYYAVVTLTYHGSLVSSMKRIPVTYYIAICQLSKCKYIKGPSQIDRSMRHQLLLSLPYVSQWPYSLLWTKKHQWTSAHFTTRANLRIGVQILMLGLGFSKCSLKYFTHFCIQGAVKASLCDISPKIQLSISIYFDALLYFSSVKITTDIL